MKYMAMNNEGHSWPVANLIDKDENETDVIEKAVGLVIKLSDTEWLPVLFHECPFYILTVH